MKRAFRRMKMQSNEASFGHEKLLWNSRALHFISQSDASCLQSKHFIENA